MYWFILLFPFMIYPWGSNPIFTTTKPLYLQLFVLFMWLVIIVRKKYKTIELGKTYKVEILLSVFFLIICLSTILSEYPMTAIYGTNGRSEGLFTFLAYFSIFLFSYRFLKEEQLKNIIPGIVITSILVSVYGILQHFQLDFLPRSSGRIGYDRSYAFFGNPNFYGSYLVLIIMLGATLFLSSKTKRTSTLFLVALGLAFVALLFTGTRSGWVGTFCALLFMSFIVVLKRKDLLKKWFTLILTLVSLTIIVNTVDKVDYSARVNTFVVDTYKVVSNQSTGHEGSSRLFIWEKSLPLVKEYFLLGSGPDTFKYVFPATPEEREKYLGVKNMIVDKAHNEYLHMAITLGIPALLFYLSLIIVILGRAFKAVKVVQDKERIVLYGFISAVFGYLVQAFFNISVVSVAPFFWCLLGVTLAISEKSLQVNKREQLNKDQKLNLSA